MRRSVTGTRMTLLGRSHRKASQFALSRCNERYFHRESTCYDAGWERSGTCALRSTHRILVRIAQQSDSGPFDLVISGSTSGTDVTADRDKVAPFAEAGATWWSEGRLPWGSTLADVRARIRCGPPQL
jgi:hypothetical protein